MTVEELYERIGNYEEAKSHLMNDRFIAKFVVKFPGDVSFDQLMNSWERQDDREVFRAAHTMKGVCANLALTGLMELVSEITEAYRPGTDECPEDMSGKFRELRLRYDETVAAIRQYEEEV